MDLAKVNNITEALKRIAQHASASPNDVCVCVVIKCSNGTEYAGTRSCEPFVDEPELVLVSCGAMIVATRTFVEAVGRDPTKEELASLKIEILEVLDWANDPTPHKMIATITQNLDGTLRVCY